MVARSIIAEKATINSITNMDRVIFNGKTIKRSQANISIYDQGYFYDFTVYSTIKFINKKLFFNEYHISRLFESARILGIKHNFTRKQIGGWLKLLVKKSKLKSALIKIVLIGDAINNSDAKIYIFIASTLTLYSKKYYDKGAKLISYTGERYLPDSKSKNLLLNFLAYRKAKRSHAIDAILIDHKNNIREGTRSNFFAVIAYY